MIAIERGFKLEFENERMVSKMGLESLKMRLQNGVHSSEMGLEKNAILVTISRMKFRC